MVAVLVFLGSLAYFTSPTYGVGPANPEAKRGTVEDFIQTYFHSWSDKDFGTYRACFDDSARIWYAMPDGSLRSADLGEFIKLQRQAHRSSTGTLRELPVKSTSTEWGDVAQVRVYWRLEEGFKESFGNDFFTLVRKDGEWRVAGLVFNEESKP